MRRPEEMSTADIMAEAEEGIANVRELLESLISELRQLEALAPETSFAMEATSQLRILNGFHPRSPQECIDPAKLHEALTWLAEERRGVEKEKAVVAHLRLVEASHG